MVRDPSGDKPEHLLQAAPAVQARTDPPPELPLGVEAFRSPLHMLPTGPQPREDPHVRAAFFVVATLSIVVGIIAAFALQGPDPGLTEVTDDHTSSPSERVPLERTNAIVIAGTASAAIATSQRDGPSPPSERQPPQRKPPTLAKTASEVRDPAIAPPRSKRRASAHSATRRAFAKPAPATLAELPARSAVLAAMRSVTKEARSCLDGPEVADVDIMFSGATGKVGAATVRGVTDPAASCIARAVRRAKLQPFAKPRLDITYPIRASE